MLHPFLITGVDQKKEEILNYWGGKKLMARYIGPVEKLSRRENINLYLKGKRSYTEKSSLRKRNFAPGQHGRQPKKS